MLRFILIVTFMFTISNIWGQTIAGYVYDEENVPVPYANVFLKNIGYGTTTDGSGKYFIQLTDPGVYDLVYSAVGFEKREKRIILKDREEVIQNIWLKTDVQELEEIIVDSKGKDPAYGIISKAMDQKERWREQYQSSTSRVYIKALEVISEKEKKKRARKKAKEDEVKATGVDDFDIEDKKTKKEKEAIKEKIPNMNMVEVKMLRHYQAPNKVKEIREAYKKYGSDYGLYFTNTVEDQFNFYENLIDARNLNLQPLVSPLHFTSFLTYKFKLEETSFVNDQMLYKIKVTPLKRGNATWEGYIWILESYYCILKVDLQLSGHGLIIFDEFSIQQEYEFIEDSTLVLSRQAFEYTSKAGKQDFKGKTIATFRDYEINPQFSKNYFRNEVAVTTQEAYDRDSTYWGQIRPEPLTKEEQEFQHKKDSIKAYVNSEEYLDSMDAEFNKVTFLDVVWDGIEFSNRKKKRHWGVSSIPGLLNPFSIGGLRIGPSGWFFKKWDNEKYLLLSGGTDIGVRNKDVKGYFSTRFRYDPMHGGYVGFYVGSFFSTIMQNDAVTNLFLRSNWIEENSINMFHNRELWNGLYTHVSVRFKQRNPIDGYEFGKITEDWFDGQNQPLEFEAFNSTKLQLSLSYVPFQKYMREPHRKVILGSKWPTFTLYYEKGVPKVFGSEINYDYVSFDVKQDFKLGTLGTSSYLAHYGKFLNTKDLRYVDYVIFPRGDKWFFASQMQSMQIQDTTLYANDSHIRLHYSHHFNGAIINFVPLIKKLQIHMVVGASALWIKDSDYLYTEYFIGAERSFKLQRARYRLGVYFVAATSTMSSIQPRIKFAFNRYRLKDKTWGY